MSAVAVIPARYGSTRLAAKPLLRETGKYLVQHVFERVVGARRIARTLIATDDERIHAAARSFGAEVVMTDPDCPSGTDRLAEVARSLPGGDDDLFLNVQGDEPDITASAVDALVERMERDPATPCGTLASPMPPDVDRNDPAAVKVVLDRSGRGLYFSRAAIPFDRDGLAGEFAAPWLLHLGVYAYRRAFLNQFTRWQPGPLERLERLEQLRILEHGGAIAVQIVPEAFRGVDTPEDYRRFVDRWRVAHPSPRQPDEPGARHGR